MGYIAQVPDSGDSVGTLSLQACKRVGIPTGKIPADGQELSQTVYADLFRWASSGAVTTTDETSWQGSANNRAMWVLNSKTPGCFRIADLNGAQPGSLVLFGRGSALDSGVGSIKQDQLQNITADLSLTYASIRSIPNGAFKKSVTSSTSNTSPVFSSTGNMDILKFDASDSPGMRTGTETYPSHFTGIWCYQAFSTVNNSGAIDAVQLATQVAALQAQLSIMGQPVKTASFQFIRSTNEIIGTNIVTDLSLDVGDIIQISDSANNNFTMTVEIINNSNDINVNYAHRNGAGTLSLINETVTCTIKRITKWYNAADGIGQGTVNVTALRTNGTFYTNSTNRTFLAYAYGNSGGTGSYLYVDRGNNPVSTIPGGAPSGNALAVSITVSPGGLYRWLWGGGTSIVEISEIR